MRKMASSLYKAQLPFRSKGQTTCIHHRGKQLDLYCKKCLELVCIKCLSSVHDSHTVSGLDDISPKMQQDIQTFINKTEKEDLDRISRYISSTEEKLEANARHFGKLSDQIKAQNETLKEELDMLSAQTLSRYKQMEEDNERLLQTYKQDLKMHSIHLQETVQECKEALQGGSKIDIFDANCAIHSSAALPSNPTLGTASFRSNSNPQEYLAKAMGELDVSSQVRGKETLAKNQSVKTPHAGQGLTAKQGKPSLSKSKKASSKQRSLGKEGVSTKMLEEWKASCMINSISPTTDGKLWTNAYTNNTLTLLDRSGQELQKVKHSTGIMDISLSPSVNTLWVCDKEGDILELTSDRLVKRFSITEEPQCICITHDKHILIGMESRISKFSSTGKMVLTSRATVDETPLVGQPHRLTECPVTHNVAVADWDRINQRGVRKKCVVVVDANLKELFVYDGAPDSQSGGKPFDPSGVGYNSVGNLVVGDHTNNRVLLIGGNGESLGVLYTDNYRTQAIGVNKKDGLWAVFGYKYVKLLQYYNM